MKERVSSLAKVKNTNVRSYESKAGATSSSSFRGVFGFPVVNKGLAGKENTEEGESQKDSLDMLEEEFVLATYDSDDNKKKKKKKKKGKKKKDDAFSGAQLDLADKVHKRGRYEESDSTRPEEEEEEIDEENELQLPQVFYCSRTHSQLAQFVEELRKTAHGEGCGV